MNNKYANKEQKILEELEGWRERNSERKERQDQFNTSSIDEIPSISAPIDTNEESYLDNIGFPGEYPFTRGVQPTMYRGRLWSMRQYAGFGTPEETNTKFRYLLSQGQTGLSVAFDLPTQLGYNSDDPESVGEVGKVGVAIDSLRDMEVAFEGIPLDKVSTSMTINAPAAVLVAMYVAVAEKQGVSPDQLTGTAQNDVLKEYVARGTYIFPPEPSLRLAADLVAYCAEKMPRFNSISISGYHLRDAGSTAAQEIAFTFANAIAYGEAFTKRGVQPDIWGQRVSWIFNTHNNFLEEIAKYRALRRMWARIMKEQFGAENPRALMLRTHSQTGGSTLTAQQPLNNIVRAAYQALAAVLGGVQSLALSTFDEALSLPTDEAQRIALRTQQIIAHETGIADAIDPLAGSYHVEWLTDKLEENALAYMAEIDQLGGAVAAIEAGVIQREIAKASYESQLAVEEKKELVVGVNSFKDGNEDPSPAIFRVNRNSVDQQKISLEKIRKERDNSKVEKVLAELKSKASGSDDLMSPILDAVRSYATVGEICDALRTEFGSYSPPVEI
ncbi:MAG: methylmalonyl-CoA mutase family protein [Chloroflexota bacterium]|nr:methylmalonyl-CoA mutase family protein [Chloroflexota bacterium]|tara:strand:- start:18557 stop:20230 length:1674 start_codon:yes stop_codon:yes gene_type:complete